MSNETHKQSAPAEHSAPAEEHLQVDISSISEPIVAQRYRKVREHPACSIPFILFAGSILLIIILVAVLFFIIL